MKKTMLDFLDNTAKEEKQPEPQSREDLLKYERSRKKPITSNDDLIKPRIKLETDLIYSKIQSKPKPKPKQLPENLRTEIERMAGEEGQEDFSAVLVTQTVLDKTNFLKNCFEFPIEWVKNRFLSREEERFLWQHNNNYMAVPIIGKVPALNLRRVNRGFYGVFYVLGAGGDWKDVVKENRLREGTKVQLWAFRINKKLNFAFVFKPRRKFAEMLRCLAICCG